MTILNKYIKKEAELKRLSEELALMQNDERLKEEMAFLDSLNSLLEEYGKSKREVVQMLSPDEVPTTKKGRAKRRLKRYTNPNTGEVVEARSSNHTTLKQWKEEHGKETVESWAVET